MEDLLFTQLVVGLSRAMLLFVIAAGLSIILGIMRVVNFANGSFYMLGAYCAYSVVGYFLAISPDAGFWIALVCAPIVLALVGGAVERFGLRRVYDRREILVQVLLTYAVVLIISDVVRLAWGADFKLVDRPDVLAGGVSLGGVRLPVYNLFLLGIGPLMALGLWLLLYRTNFGKRVRAVAADRDIASTLGINVPRLYTLVFMLGSALAGLGGALTAPVGALNPAMDAIMGVQAIVVIVIGGLGSFRGCLVASIIVGLTDAFGILVLPRIALVSIFLVMVVVLIVRPWGLFGSPLIMSTTQN
jgi:branched-chain amino acid transport system permease protein